MTDLPENISLSIPVVLAAFARALDRASEFVGATAPNPPVGCVLLDAQGNPLASAAHQKAGQPHAEALAIETCRQQGTIGRIHTVIVTLEPCNHTGHTPPCSDAILQTPAREIWIGASDPNPTVRGKGAQKLAAKGLRVGFIQDLDAQHLGGAEAAHLAKAAKRLIAPFAKHKETAMPWVTIKQAVSRTGSMIPEVGRKTFTSKSSLIFAHKLRKRADAILTGSGTILADSPEFTVRHVPDFANKTRHLVVLDRRGRVPEAYISTARKAGFDVHLANDLHECLTLLGQAGVLEVLVEAGPTLIAAVLNTPFWDEHITITQGKTLDNADKIATRYRADLHETLNERGEDVLRNC